MQPCLTQHIADMAFNGALADPQSLSNLTVRHPLGHKLDHTGFGGGEINLAI